MKIFFASIVTFLIISSRLLANDFYKVEIKTFVGSKLDSVITFTMEPNTKEKKGFEGKLLAKGFNANGFEHHIISEIERLNKEKEALEQEKQAAAANAKKTLSEALSSTIEEKINALDRECKENERKASGFTSRIALLEEKREILEKILSNIKASPTKAKGALEAYMTKYETSEDLRRHNGKSTDYTEFDLGTYCEFALGAVSAKGAVFTISYGYSSPLSWTILEGYNNGNVISRSPVFESYFKYNLENISLPAGAEYCIQFGRQDPRTAGSLQDALNATTLFSKGGKGASAIDEANAIMASNASPLDAHGLLTDIKKRFASEDARTIRAVIKITPVKL